MLEASGRGGNSAFIHHNAKGSREVRKSPRARYFFRRGGSRMGLLLEVLLQAALRHAGQLLTHRAGTSLTHTVHGAQVLKGRRHQSL